MSATADVPNEVEEYLAACRTTLADLPAAERDDLLAEVEASLRDTAEDGGSIRARLGAPQDFATELRSAAGLEDSPLTTAERDPLFEVLRRVWVDPRVAAVRGVANKLAPLWWIVRAYLAVAGIAALTDARWSGRYPFLPRIHGANLTVLLLVAAVVLSVVVGLGSSTAWKLVLVGNLACVLLALPVLPHLDDAQPERTVLVQVPAAAPAGLLYDGAPVGNIYPYSIDGRLLHDVLLYDGAGRPLAITSSVPDPNRRTLRTTANKAVFNSFPIRYYEPGTVRVAHPNAAPRIRIPEVLPRP